VPATFTILRDLNADVIGLEEVTKGFLDKLLQVFFSFSLLPVFLYYFVLYETNPLSGRVGEE
jgi:hypothetical protein